MPGKNRQANMDEELFFKHIKTCVGHHRLTSMLIRIRKEPTKIETAIFNLRKYIKNKIPSTVKNLSNSLLCLYIPLSQLIDLVKDVVFILIIKNILSTLSPKNEDAQWWFSTSNSEAEKYIFVAMLTSIIIAYAIICIYCYIYRNIVLISNFPQAWTRVLFESSVLILVPFLPFIYSIHHGWLKIKNYKLKAAYRKKAMKFEEFLYYSERLSKQMKAVEIVVADIKVLEGALESIPQLIFLLLYVSFLPLHFYGTHWKRSYSYSVGTSLLNTSDSQQKILFYSSLVLSLIGPIKSCVRHTDTMKNGSLNIQEKIVLVIFQAFLLVSRVICIVSVLVLPVFKQWDMLHFENNEELTDSTDFSFFYYSWIEYSRVSKECLADISKEITSESLNLCIFFSFHIFIILSYSFFKSPNLRKSTTSKILFHLISNLFLVLPFRDPATFDSDDESKEEFVLVIFHLFGNICLMMGSKLYLYKFDLSMAFSLPHVYFELLFLLPVCASIFFAMIMLHIYKHKIHVWSFLQKHSKQLTNHQCLFVNIDPKTKYFSPYFKPTFIQGNLKIFNIVF